jgi:hypothetical protein
MVEVKLMRGSLNVAAGDNAGAAQQHPRVIPGKLGLAGTKANVIFIPDQFR